MRCAMNSWASTSFAPWLPSRREGSSADEPMYDAATTSPDAEKASYETKLQLLLHPPPSSIRGTMKILQPYFWPAGIVNKLRTFATFLIMGGSKACTECRRITAGVPPDCHRIAI